MTGKSYNFFDEYSARYAYLPLHEDECTSSSWGNSKMQTSGTIGNSQGMPTEINKNGAVVKVKILVEKVGQSIQEWNIKFVEESL